MLGIVATLKLKPGEEATFESELKSMIKTVAAEEPGCLQYDMFKHQSEPGTYVMMERYTDQAAMDAHMSSPHFQALIKKLGNVLAGPPEINVLDAVE